MPKTFGLSDDAVKTEKKGTALKPRRVKQSSFKH